MCTADDSVTTCFSVNQYANAFWIPSGNPFFLSLFLLCHSFLSTFSVCHGLLGLLVHPLSRGALQYDGRIVKVAVHAMPVMLVCHCMFAIFVFSGGAFFESAYLADALSSDVDVRGGGRTKRQTNTIQSHREDAGRSKRGERHEAS